MGEIRDELEEIKELIKQKEEKPKKKKKFRLPFSAKINSARAKNNWVTIMRINENGQVTFKRTQINEQTFVEEGIPRLASAGYVTYYKNNPMIILPSWSVEPFSPMEHYNKSLVNGSNAKGFRILLAAMKSQAIDQKKMMARTFKWIIGLGLAAIIGYAFITGGG